MSASVAADAASAGRPASVLCARGLSIERAGGPVVSGVDLDLRRGEIVALLGPNGAGKSTLLQGLAGLLGASAGTIESHGRVAAGLQAPALARRSVLANVEAALAWWGVPRAQREARARTALAEVGAGHLAVRPATGLSGGEARRVHLARVLAVGPEVLLLDEPFAGLDPVTLGDLLYDAASALRHPDRATLVVVHDRAEAWALADRVALMMDGRIVALGTPSQVFESPPSLATAEFVGFSGRLRRGDSVLALRPADVELDSRGPLRATVHRRVPVEDGVRLDLELAEGRLVCHSPMPGPDVGQEVRVRATGGVRF